MAILGRELRRLMAEPKSLAQRSRTASLQRQGIVRRGPTYRRMSAAEEQARDEIADYLAREPTPRQY